MYRVQTYGFRLEEPGMVEKQEIPNWETIFLFDMAEPLVEFGLTQFE